ncbi:MAG: 2,3-bisphosphoglycerate-independent phosphoglycerate mutase [Candidatus Bathyarchaeota archaeon]|nr:2,3-bisphosphoglycerate-independent phosphoglycerate mutase [Candidatus Termiticorpusculum sp.]MCL2868315.1 2,3-bisphosphoglycerate-independent phosphoglycerate mutase [Candidatus Termiticorpusculum sp.]
MRCVLIVGDGMADLPLQELGDMTPLEVANVESMNALACRGVLGLLDPIAPGIAPGSDAANLAFLGYDSEFVCRGRGAFEAAGLGLNVGVGDLAFRCNFVTVDEGLCLVDERAGRIGGVEAKVLGECVEQVRLRVHSNVEVFFRQGLGFKGALVLRGEGLSGNVSAVLPKVGSVVGAVAPLDGSFEAKHTADVLNEFIHLSNQMLRVHPVNVERVLEGKLSANAVLPWSGCGRPDMVPFGERYGLRASCVAAASLIKGIGKFSGMDIVDVVGATGDLDTDTLAKADAVFSAFEAGSDFVYVHVEAPDEASHDGNVAGKIGIIQKIDALVGRIMAGVDLLDTVVVLVSDHVTSCRFRAHTGDAVPVCFAGGNVVSDGVNGFSERLAYKGGLGRIRGKDIMPMVLNYMGKPEKLGW